MRFLIQNGKQVPSHNPRRRKNIDDKMIFISTSKMCNISIIEKYPQNR